MRKLELTPFEHTHLCIALEAHIDSLKTYCIDLKKRESPDQWDESSMQKEIKKVEALYERCMNLDKKQYSVSLYFETGISTSVIASNEAEAEEIAINNFRNKSIKELSERDDEQQGYVSSEYLYDLELSEYTLPVVEEEE
jgi:hypothetical protein